MSPPNLVLIPGLLCSARLFAAQVAALSDRVDVTVADHASHDTMPAIARAVLDAAPARFALAGLSMGGYVAHEIMRQAPERVERLCLLNSRARRDSAGETAGRHRLLDLGASDGVTAVQRTLLPRLIRPDRIGEEPLTSRILAMAGDVGEAGFRRQMAAIMTRGDQRPVLPSIRCPTTVIVGSMDVLTPPDMAREMADLIPGARLVTVAGCGHLSSLEAADEVTGLLSAWLGV